VLDLLTEAALDSLDGTGADFAADQPRVPAGSPEGGRFGPGGGSGGGGTKAERSAARVERKRAAKAKERQASGRAKQRNDALAAAHEAIQFAHGFMPKLTGAAGYFLRRAVEAVHPETLSGQPLARKSAALRALRDEATRTASRVRRDPAAVPAAARPDVLNGLREIARRADRAAALLRREARERHLPGVQSAQFAAQAPVRFTPLDSGESDFADPADPVRLLRPRGEGRRRRGPGGVGGGPVLLPRPAPRRPGAVVARAAGVNPLTPTPSAAA
jgi:hypothetical protein